MRKLRATLSACARPANDRKFSCTSNHALPAPNPKVGWGTKPIARAEALGPSSGLPWENVLKHPQYFRATRSELCEHRFRPDSARESLNDFGKNRLVTLIPAF